MGIVEYSQYHFNKLFYGGSEKKIGILINNERYIVKFQKDSEFGLRYNHISEYIGSHIFNLVGLTAQETKLGTYNGQNVVVMKDFLKDGETFVPFDEVGESSLDIDNKNIGYSYNEIMTLLQANKKLTNVEKTIETFWDMYIIDALIGNFDRHSMNWGFIKNNNKYRLAPIFDNGSSLYPQMNSDEDMLYILNNQDEIDKRIYTFPTSQIKIKGKKSSYYEVINNLKFKECNEALLRVYPKIDLIKINQLIDDIPSISSIHKEFYKTMLLNRYNKIILDSYLKLVNK